MSTGIHAALGGDRSDNNLMLGGATSTQAWEAISESLQDRNKQYGTRCYISFAERYSVKLP